MHGNAQRIVTGFSLALAAGTCLGMGGTALAQPATPPPAAPQPTQSPAAIQSLLQPGGDAQVHVEPAAPAFDWTGITFFYPQGLDAQTAPLTPHFDSTVDLSKAPASEAARGGGGAFAPVYEKSGETSVVRITVPADASLYGAGAAGGTLLRSGAKVQCRAATGGLPWVLGVRADGSAFGVLFDSTWEGEVEFPASGAADAAVVYRTSGPACRVVTIEGETPEHVLRRFGLLTGPAAYPPRWAMGNQVVVGDSSEDALKAAAADLRKNNIPADAIWLDAGVLNKSRPFTSDNAKLPNPIGLDAELAKTDLSLVWPSPGAVPEANGYWVRDQLVLSGFGVRAGDDKPVFGTSAAGDFYTPDFSRPDARSWWGGLQKELVAKGADGVLLSSSGIALPAKADFSGGSWIDATGPATGSLARGPRAQYANVNTMLMAKASREGMLKARAGLRPLVVTGESWIGSNRYGAPMLAAGGGADEIARVLNLSLSGQPVLGSAEGGLDVGIASLMPLCATKLEASPGASMDTVRAAMRRRHRLMPLLTTLVEEATYSNVPVVRPLFFADPSDLSLRGVQDAFLLGSDLLVMPGALRDSAEAPFPKSRGKWERVDLVGAGELGNSALPDLYIRPGAILPLGPMLESTSQKHGGPLTLLINLDADGQAAGSLYEDAGEGFEYLRSVYLRTDYVATLAGDRFDLKIAAWDGKHPRGTRELLAVIVRDGHYYQARGQDGMSLRLNFSKLNPVKVGEASHVGGADPAPVRGKATTNKPE